MPRFNRKHPNMLPHERVRLEKILAERVMGVGGKQIRYRTAILQEFNTARVARGLPLLDSNAIKSMVCLILYLNKVSHARKKNENIKLVLPDIDLPEDVLNDPFFREAMNTDEY